jgi:hypothetical protein
MNKPDKKDSSIIKGKKNGDPFEYEIKMILKNKISKDPERLPHGVPIREQYICFLRNLRKKNL